MAESLQLGAVTNITMNTVYALPGKLCYVTSDTAVEHSLDGTVFVALTGANTVGVLCGSAFVRCSTAAAKILCKEAK